MNRANNTKRKLGNSRKTRRPHHDYKEKGFGVVRGAEEKKKNSLARKRK